MNTSAQARRCTHPSAFGRVAVLMGGQSAERDVSLKSGAAIHRALLDQGVAAEAVDVDGDVVRHLMGGGFDRAFIALHGRGGEDGVIQGALQLLGIPYTGSGVLACALSMDKVRTKQIWRAQDLPTPAYLSIASAADMERAADQLGLPMVIKPSHEGSSVGMSLVDGKDQFHVAFEQARKFDSEVIAEAFIRGREYTAAILDGDVLPMIRLETPHRFYDYAAKYEASTTRYFCPSGLGDAVEGELVHLVRRAFASLDGRGWGRIDFMLDEAGQPWLLEMNAIPGMTDHSLVPMAAKAAGIAFEDLVWRILETSISDPEGGRR